jgi:hypothetical protein
MGAELLVSVVGKALREAALPPPAPEASTEPSPAGAPPYEKLLPHTM